MNLVININKFNEIVNKNYTEEQLQQKLSELICGYLYIQINKDIIKAVNMCKSPRNTYNIRNGIHLFFLDLMKMPIINDRFCQENFNCSLEEFNQYGIDTKKYKLKQLILNNDYNELIDYLNTLLKQQVKEIITNAHENRNKYLLELDNDDKIDQYYGEIDYDPHTVQFRDAPIVVYKDFENNQDKVLIGKFGEAHIDCINRTDKTIPDKSKGYISECYYYEPSAFIDKSNGKYTINEVTRILKNDFRIQKVYLSPGMKGGKLKRLAQLL